MNYMYMFQLVKYSSLGVLNAPIRAGTILKSLNGVITFP